MQTFNIIQNNQSTTKLINILKNSDTQYLPLNKQEERKLIEKYRNNRTKLNELLYMHNIRLAFNMAKKYATKTNDFDSLVSDCLYGLSIACQRFDIDKGIKFSTYATSWIFKYCLSSFYDKQNILDKSTISLNSTSNYLKTKSNNGNEVTFENYINEYIEPSITYKSIDDELSSIEMNSICKVLLDKLNDDTSLSSVDKQVFIDYIYHKEKARDISSKYGISVKDIMSIKSKILTKFKNILSNKFNIHNFTDLTS